MESDNGDEKIDASKALEDVPEENKFICKDGKVLSNLNDLQKALKEMSEETFNHHVSNEKNDFYNWINHVIKNNFLSNRIKRIKSKKSAEKKMHFIIKELKIHKRMEESMPKIGKEKAVKILSNVPEENRFWCNDGKIFSNLFDLQNGLKDMNEDTFRYHVNKEKNDFYNWVKEVIEDEFLAKELKKTKGKKTFEKKLGIRIEKLKDATS